MKNKLSQNNRGFSLMEVMVSLFVIMILMLGIYSLIILALRVTADNQFYVEAISIANQKMEQIRNLSYSDVGVVGGIPAGILPPVETIYREGVFTINTYITYFDDEFDGLVGSSTPDAIPNDYKIATVKVGWLSRVGLKNITVFTKIIPRTVETFAGYGLLKIYVGNASAQPMANANVRVINNSVSPAIDVVNLTNNSGILYLPATSSNQGYEITVTKTDEEFMGVYYGQDGTYDLSTAKSPYHLSVTAGNMTEESFTIDKLARLQVRTVSADLPDNWRVNQANATSETKARASLDSANNMYFVWQSWSGPASYVYVQKYNSAEVKQWASDYKISSTQYQTNPDIVTTGAGNSFVVWQDNSFSLKQVTYQAPVTGFAAKEIIKTAKIISAWPFRTNGEPEVPAVDFSLPTSVFNSTVYRLSGHEAKFARNGILSNILNKLTAGSIRLINEDFRINFAQAAGAIVQAKIGSPQSGVNTLTATFDNPPTAGNVIIAIAIHRNNNSSFSAPVNSAGTFTQSAYSNTSWYLDVGIWHKAAGAGEPSLVSITNSGNIDGGVLMIMEVSGLDTADLLGVTTVNDQTGGSSNTANTGSTVVSGASGFAVAAIGWADNNFNTPTSASWSSVSADSWTHRLWDDWSTGNNGSLAVATLNITAAAAQRATLTTTGGGGEERNSALAVFKIAVPNNITVSAAGAQTASTTIPTANVQAGGQFVFTDNTGAHTVTGLTITEDGTVDAANDLENIKLFYDLDTSAPYNCASESYGGGELQFGSTDSNGFSSSNGTSSFSGSVNISTTQTMCVYVVFDVKSSAGKDTTVNLKINNPSIDVIINSGSVMPALSVEPAGSTMLNKPAEMRQIHYRWRNDDGAEAAATWQAAEDTGTTITGNTVIRLRLAVTNGGSLASGPVQYRVEYGENPGTCAAIGSWTALPFDNTRHWRIIDSTFINDADPTTNNSGLTDENTSWQAGQIKDLNNQTSAISLNADGFTEIEYTVEATSNVTSNPYCFRLTNIGSTIGFNYLIYPEISVIGDDNIYIVSLATGGSERWAVKRVNQDMASESQSDPKIAVTENFGLATATVVWTDGRNGQSDIYAQVLDDSGGKILANDLRITSSSTEEHSADIVFDNNDNFFVAWVEDAPTAKKIYLQKYQLSDQSAWPENKNIVSSAYDVYSPALAVDNANNLYLIYVESVAGIQNIYMAKYDNDGNFIWEVQANQEAASFNQFAPALTVNASYAYAAWVDQREGNNDIYAQKHDLNGNALWTEDLRISIDTGTSTQSYPGLLVNSAGDPFAAWEDDRGGDYDIFATKFSDPGTIAGEANVPLRVRGTKTISETPVIYEYDDNFYTDANGYANLMVEDDTPGYYVDLVAASTSLSIILRDPVQPLELMPDEAKTWLIFVE